MSTRTLCSALALAASTLLSSAAHAEFLEPPFFALNPGSSTDQPMDPSFLDQTVKNKVAAFTSNLTDISTFEFEGRSPFAATTGTASAVALDGGWRLCGVGYSCPNGDFKGRYNTTGMLSNTPGDGAWVETTSPSQVSTFSFEFADAINAFGFFGTDFYDFAGTVTYELFTKAGAEVEDDGTSGRTIGTTTGTDGALFFYGLQATTAFNKIVFTIGQSTDDMDVFDYVGFDSLIIGNLSSTNNDTPEPGSLALMGAALLGVWASRRKGRNA